MGGAGAGLVAVGALRMTKGCGSTRLSCGIGGGGGGGNGPVGGSTASCKPRKLRFLRRGVAINVRVGARRQKFIEHVIYNSRKVSPPVIYFAHDT